MNLKVLDKIQDFTGKLEYIVRELRVIANQYDLNEVQDYEERYAIIEPYIDALTQAARSPEPVKTEAEEKSEARPFGPPKIYRSVERLKEDGDENRVLSKNALNIHEALVMGKKLNAIKEIRIVTNAGLKEAKEFVDVHWNARSVVWVRSCLSLNGVLIWDDEQVSNEHIKDVLEKAKGGF